MYSGSAVPLSIHFFQHLNSEMQGILHYYAAGIHKTHNSPGEPMGVSSLLTRIAT